MTSQAQIKVVIVGVAVLLLVLPFTLGRAQSETSEKAVAGVTYTKGQFCAVIPIAARSLATAIFPAPDGFTISACQKVANDAFRIPHAVIRVGCASSSGIAWSDLEGIGAAALSCGWH
jgi:hypothetical protein